MLKKTAGILTVGLLLSACDEPAGGNGYFDQVDMPAQVTEEPITLMPVEEPATGAQAEPASEDTATADSAATTETDSSTIATDDGTLNLYAETFAEQEEKRTEAALLLQQARENLVIIEAGELPEIVAGVNIAAYARETTNAVGERLYKRPIIAARFHAQECARFDTPDDAQRYFLANGGPEKDPLNLDPDGDGFACRWSPEVYRQLQ